MLLLCVASAAPLKTGRHAPFAMPSTIAVDVSTAMVVYSHRGLNLPLGAGVTRVSLLPRNSQRAQKWIALSVARRARLQPYFNAEEQPV